MADLTLEELQKFSYRLAAIPAIVCFLLHFLGLNVIAHLLSVVIHVIILGVFFLLFKEFKSAFLKFIFVALIMCFVGEVLVLFNSSHIKYDGVYWAFMGTHFVRDTVLSIAFAWNVFKSHINNELWVKVVPYVCVIPVFFVIQAFIFSQEELYPIVFLVYNVSLCLTLLTAALRWYHTSNTSYFFMVIAIAAFILSEIFYFLEFFPENADTFMQNLRTPFLQLGSCLMVSATVDHVIHFKLTAKQRIYLQMTDKESNVLRGRITPQAPSVVSNILTIGTKNKMKEPLI